MNKICPVCKNVIVPKRKGRNVFVCSRKCWGVEAKNRADRILEDRNKEIARLRFQENLSMIEIAKRVNLTPSRVSQIGRHYPMFVRCPRRYFGTVVVLCDNCGKSVVKKSGVVARLKTGKKFCGNECSKAYRHKHRLSPEELRRRARINSKRSYKKNYKYSDDYIKKRREYQKKYYLLNKERIKLKDRKRYEQLKVRLMNDPRLRDRQRLRQLYANRIRAKKIREAKEKEQINRQRELEAILAPIKKLFKE